jgi:glucose-6-phosphate isomerase
MSNRVSKHLRADRTPTWAALQAHFAASGKSFDLREAFAADPQRVASLSQSAPCIFADMSKNLTDTSTEKLLLDLARECGLEAHRDAMFAGDHINTTEDRAVVHTLLRAPAAKGMTGKLA